MSSQFDFPYSIMRCLCSFLLFIFLVFSATEQRSLPPYIKPCSLKHDVNECFKNHANEAMPTLIKGDTSYNIPVLAPLKLSFVPLIKSNDLSVNVTNLNVLGLEKAQVVEVTTNMEKGLHMTYVLTIPNITLDGMYSINGKIMALPINGQGKFFLNLSFIKYTMGLTTYDKNGVEYYKTNGEGLSLEFGKVHFDLGNLFDGDEKLGEQINQFLNENWQTLLSEFGPVLSVSVSEVVDGIFNSVAKDVPAKEVFLQD